MKKTKIVFLILIMLIIFIFLSQHQIVRKINCVLNMYDRETEILIDQKILLKGEYISKVLDNKPKNGTEFRLEIEHENRQYTLFYFYSTGKQLVFHGFGYCQEHNKMEPCQLTTTLEYSVCRILTGHQENIYAVDACLSQYQIKKNLRKLIN